MSSPSTEAGITTPRVRTVSTTVWFGLGSVILAAALIRLRLINVPFERDEGEHAYAGQLLLSGVPPYTLLYSQKFPGIYIAFAAAMALFGQTIAGARLGLLLVTSATSLGVFRLARRFVPSPDAVAGAAAYSVLALSTEMLGPFGHATHFVALFAVWGLALLPGIGERATFSRYLASGSLLGIAVLMKQPGAVFLACAAVWIVAGPAGEKGRHVGALILGAAIPSALMALWLAASGALGRLWYWTVRYAMAYGSQQSLGEGWENLRLAVSRFVPQAGILWVLAGCGAALLATRRQPLQARLRIGSLVLFSFAGVSPGLYFRDHYFLLFVPAAAIAVALASAEIRSRTAAGRWVSPAVIVLACAQALYAQREILLRAEPEEISRLVYGPDLFPESIRIAGYLRARTRPEDRLVIFGSEPQIYFYAGRRSATGFVFMYPLMQRHTDVRRMQEMMIREVEDACPAYAVLVKTPTSWLERPDSDHRMQDWATRYLAERYVIAGQVVVSDSGSRDFWDEEAARRPIEEATQALILRRRDFVPVVP